MQPRHVLEFWFEQSRPAQWWKKDPAYDDRIRQRFGALHQLALDNQLGHWANTPAGALALIIVLDQFSRNLYRDSARAFAGDGQALALCLQVLACGWQAQLSPRQYPFLCMPLMHSEDLAMQERSVQLLTGTGSEKAARAHQAIIARFGRFPHRNHLLGRSSTAQERQFLLHHPGF